MKAKADELKKKKEFVSIDERDIRLEENGQEENYLEILACKIEQVRRGIEKLGDEDRVIISLFLLEGYDHEEIAQVLDLPIGTVKSRIARGRRLLIEKLGNHDPSRERHTNNPRTEP